MNKNLFIIFMLFCTLLSCTVQELLDTANVKKPEVDLSRISISDLSFESISLLFDFSVRNPNAVGARLTSLIYDLEINSRSFISGNQDKGIELPARGESSLELPVTFVFDDLYRIYQDLKDKDSTTYKISSTLSFNVPVLGAVNVPVSKSGYMPVIRIPAVSFHSLKLNSLSLSSADLTLKMQIENSNSAGFSVDQLDYTLGIGGREWVSGRQKNPISVKGKQKSVVEIPISLNILELGQSIAQALTSKTRLNYTLKGGMDVSAVLPIAFKQHVDFDRTGDTLLGK